MKFWYNNWNCCRKRTKTHHRRSRNQIFVGGGGSKPPHPHNICSHSQVHLSLDSYYTSNAKETAIIKTREESQQSDYNQCTARQDRLNQNQVSKVLVAKVTHIHVTHVLGNIVWTLYDYFTYTFLRFNVMHTTLWVIKFTDIRLVFKSSEYDSLYDSSRRNCVICLWITFWAIKFSSP